MSGLADNPYIVDLAFEADLCLRQIQGSLLTQYHQWRTPAEIIAEALYVLADHFGHHGHRGDYDGSGDDDRRPPEPPGPLPRPDEAGAVDIELRELVQAHGSPHASRERS
jgi:hypothetical protein